MTARQVALARGKDRYFTGRSCKRGHTAERYVGDRRCVECASLNAKGHHIKNSELARLRMRKWCVRNRELHNQRSRNWRANNLERMREIWRKAGAKRRRENPEKCRAISAARYAARMGAPGNYTPEEVRHLMSEQEGICAAFSCSEDITITYHVDHKNPLSRGGSSRLSNLQILCPTCNMKKSNKLYGIWLAEEREIG